MAPTKVLALIGAEGIGEVYRARDTKLNRDVALKVLPEIFGRDPDPSAGSGSSRARSRDDRLARFEREAQLLASLNHPHVAAIYGFEEGPAEAGPYDPKGARSSPEANVEANAVSGFSRAVQALVLKLVEGQTLAERIARSAEGLAIADALSMAKQIADALEAAQEHGIVHRDLKPANIKIRFGLAKLAGPAEAGHYVRSPDGRSVRLQARSRSS